jgi:winged helix-turn helix protein
LVGGMQNQTPIRIVLSEEEQQELERLSRGLVAPHRQVVRAKVVLAIAAGKSLSVIAREVGRQRRIVRKWGERFQKKRLRGLQDDPRSGRPPRFSPRDGDASGQARLRAA